VHNSHIDKHKMKGQRGVGRSGLVWILVLALLAPVTGISRYSSSAHRAAFVAPSTAAASQRNFQANPRRKNTNQFRRIAALAAEPEEEKVRVGSVEYYDGFLSRGLTEEPEERVAGDKVLVPALKFAGGAAVIIGGLLLAFLFSNGLI
jgi:hypothetical protein